VNFNLGVALTCLVFATSAGAQVTDVVTPATITADEKSSSGVHGIVAIGGAFAPKYDGASSYEPGPFAMFNIEYRGIELKMVGPSLAVNFGGDSNFEFGPSVGYSDGRKRKDMDGQFKLLDKIDGAVEVGGYAGYHLGGNDSGQGDIFVSIQAAKTMKSGRGFTVEPSVRYAAVRSDKLFVNFSLDAKVNDAKSMRTSFGITPIEAQRTGLTAYKPKGGIAQVSAGISAGYQFTKHWGVIARAQGGTLLGDAADSPITKDGSKQFGLAALGVSYSF